MDAVVALGVGDRRKLFTAAQDVVGLAPRSIEKDFWICWTLRSLFTLDGWGPHLTFKGGTALAKAWKLIERFSEDIDVVINREHLGFGGEALSNKQLERLRSSCSDRLRTQLLPALRDRISEMLPAADSWKFDGAPPEEDPDRQTLLFHYPTAFPGAAGYVSPVVKIEFGARSETEPSDEPQMTPYVADAFPDVVGGAAFRVRSLAPRRTFWEKAMLLHEETYRPPEKGRKARLSRHYYDLWSLIKKGVATEAVADDSLFDRVARHRRAFFRYGWMNYETLTRGRLRLLPTDDQLDTWRRDYQAMQAEMFFGARPAFGEIMASVGEFEAAFNRG